MKIIVNRETILNNPNDADLGRLIREAMFNTLCEEGDHPVSCKYEYCECENEI